MAKGQKGCGLRVLLALAGIACGVAVQVVSALADKFLYVQILPQYSFGVVGLLTTLLGFVVMGYCVYRWAIR